MRGIAIPFSDYKKEYEDVIDLNSSGIFIDGDRGEVIVLNPSEYLLDYLKKNKISFRELAKSEVDRYVWEVLGLIKEVGEESEGYGG